MIERSNDAFFSLYDRLFFNIYSGNSHPIIEEFVSKHTSLLRKLPRDVQWTSYPQGIDQHNWQYIKRSIQLKEHPLWNFDFWRANLEVQNSELGEHICSQELKLIFEFVTKKDGLTAFEGICNAFEPHSTKRQQILAGTNTVIYDNKDTEVGFAITIVLGRDNFRYRKYKMEITSEESLQIMR